ALLAGLVVQAGERGECGLAVADQRPVVLACRVHVAEREGRARLQQVRRRVGGQVRARVARQQPGAVGVARLQGDEAVRERGEAEVAPAVAGAAGEVIWGPDHATQDAPDEDHGGDGGGDEEGGDAEPRLHLEAEKFDAQRAGQADQPGNGRGDDEAGNDPDGEPDQLPGSAAVSACALRAATNSDAWAWAAISVPTSPAAWRIGAGNWASRAAAATKSRRFMAASSRDTIASGVEPSISSAGRSASSALAHSTASCAQSPVLSPIRPAMMSGSAVSNRATSASGRTSPASAWA